MIGDSGMLIRVQPLRPRRKKAKVGNREDDAQDGLAAVPIKAEELERFLLLEGAQRGQKFATKLDKLRCY